MRNSSPRVDVGYNSLLVMRLIRIYNRIIHLIATEDDGHDRVYLQTNF